MKDTFETMIAKLMDKEATFRLLEKGEYGVLSTVGENGYAYGVPMSYTLEKEHIYFYCAPEGMTLKNIRHDNRVSFCVVGNTRVVPEKCNVEYESVVVFGMISMDLSEEERLHAFRLIVRKYAPNCVDSTEKYVATSFDRVIVLRLDIETVSGKEKK